MNNLFTKTLLCSVLASSFLLINCQKAPNRGLKAVIPPPGKITNKVGVCTADIASEYDLLKKSDKKIQEKLTSVKPDADGNIGAPDVEELNALAKELNGLSIKVMASIAVLKVDACKIHEGNDAKKAVLDTANSASIKQVRSNAGKAIKAKTKVDNEITTEDAAAAAETLTVGQELSASAELAVILSDEANSNGAVAISSAKKIEKGTEATATLANKDVTACSMTIAKNAGVKAGAVINIVGLEDVKLVEKRNVMIVNFTVAAGTDGNAAMSLSCNIADKKEGEAAKEIRKALVGLVSDAGKVQPEPPSKPSVGVCAEGIASDYDLLKKSDKKIQEKLISVVVDANGNIAPSDVEELNGLAKELNVLSKKVLAAIAILKVDACIIHEGNDAKNPIIGTANSSSIKQVRSNAGKAIKAKTKVDNEITTEDAAAAPKVAAAEEGLAIIDKALLR